MKIGRLEIRGQYDNRTTGRSLLASGRALITLSNESIALSLSRMDKLRNLAQEQLVSFSLGSISAHTVQSKVITRTAFPRIFTDTKVASHRSQHFPWPVFHAKEPTVMPTTYKGYPLSSPRGK